jgi:hypothetical protein
MKKNIVAYDFMAKGGEHNLYQLGFILEYPNSEIFLDRTSCIQEVSEYYKIPFGDKVKYQSKYENLWKLFSHLFTNQEIHIIGASLKLLCGLFVISTLIGKRGINVHLHGQIYGYNKSLLKKKIWELLAFSFKFVVSNPALCGNSIFKRIENLNFLQRRSICCEGIIKSAVFLWVNRGVESRQARVSLTAKGFLIFPDEKNSDQSWVGYWSYIGNMRICEYVHIGFYDDYYSYSPSGRLSEAAIHNKTIIIDRDVEKINIGIEICKRYNVDFVIV